MSTSREAFVIQRKLREGVYADWRNPMNGQVEYETHAHAVRALTRRANAVDFRIVRRVWTCYDMPVAARL